MAKSPPPPDARSWFSPLFKLFRGPDPPNKEIVAAAWKALGLPGTVPPTKTSSRLPRGVAGAQPSWNQDVWLSPRISKNLNRLPFGHLPGDRLVDEAYHQGVRDPSRDALAVLMHEFTHTAQARPVKMPLREAGATLYTEQRMQDALRKMGLGAGRNSFGAKPATYPTNQYEDDVLDVLGHPGSDTFVNRSQFGRK
jgi:hypothetical protein